MVAALSFISCTASRPSWLSWTMFTSIHFSSPCRVWSRPHAFSPYPPSSTSSTWTTSFAGRSASWGGCSSYVRYERVERRLGSVGDSAEAAKAVDPVRFGASVLSTITYVVYLSSGELLSLQAASLGRVDFGRGYGGDRPLDHQRTTTVSFYRKRLVPASLRRMRQMGLTLAKFVVRWKSPLILQQQSSY